MRRSATQIKVSSKVSQTVQVRYLCHVMRQAESSRDKVQWRKNSCLRDYVTTIIITDDDDDNDDDDGSLLRASVH